MWMIDTPDVSFEGVPVKDVRDIPEYQRTIDFKISSGMLLDEIATLREVYGEGSETDSYKIFEANAPALVDAKFDLDKLKVIKIPQK